MSRILSLPRASLRGWLPLLAVALALALPATCRASASDLPPGWRPYGPPPATVSASGTRAVVRSELLSPQAAEGDDDVRVTNPAWTSGDPDIAITGAGEMWVAATDLSAGTIDLYSSTDRGATWSYHFSLLSSGHYLSRPCLVIGPGTNERMLVAYEMDEGTGSAAVEVYWQDLPAGSGGSVTVVSGGGENVGYPRLCIDSPENLPWYAYLVCSRTIGGVPYRSVRFSRSLNGGLNWSEPLTIIAVAAEDCRPDVAFGGTMCYVVAATGGDPRDISILRNSNRGASWSSAINLTNSLDDDYDPRVTVSHGSGTVVVGYTRDGQGGLDVVLLSSQNNGVSWQAAGPPPFGSPVERHAVDLAASPAGDSRLHAVYLSDSWVCHAWADCATPNLWHGGAAVSDTSAGVYGMTPAVAAHPNWVAEECVVWADFRTDVPLHVFFDRGDWPLALVRPDGLGDFADLQSAIDDANPGAIIELADGVYTGQGNVDLDFMGKDLTVRSQYGEPDGVVIDCQGSPRDPHRAFWFHSGETEDALVANLTIEHGFAGGIGKAVLPESGGGALVEGGSSPTFVNVTFRNNGAQSGGGGLHVDATAPGKAVALATSIFDCRFIGNSSSSGGGGLHYTINVAPTITHCVFYGNTSETGAGALQCEINVTATVLECTFARNGGPAAGGILLLDHSSATVARTIIAHSVLGPAVHCDATSEADLGCSDVQGNEGGDWVDCLAGQLESPLRQNIRREPMFCNVFEGALGLAAGSACLPAGSPCGQLIGVYGEACEGPVGVPDSAPAALRLDCAPNPFNPRTVLRWWQPQAGRVRLTVHDVAGRRLAVLVDERRPAGAQEVAWLGRDGRGRPLPSGIYYGRLEAGGRTVSRALVLLR